MSKLLDQINDGTVSKEALKRINNDVIKHIKDDFCNTAENYYGDYFTEFRAAKERFPDFFDDEYYKALNRSKTITFLNTLHRELTETGKITDRRSEFTKILLSYTANDEDREKLTDQSINIVFKEV